MRRVLRLTMMFGNVDGRGCADVFRFSRGIEGETTFDGGGHLLWIITRRGPPSPPLCAYATLNLVPTAADPNLPSYSHSIVITLFPFSPLSETSK